MSMCTPPVTGGLEKIMGKVHRRRYIEVTE